jgi:O-antigen/teichoic acid export membrane protein
MCRLGASIVLYGVYTVHSPISGTRAEPAETAGEVDGSGESARPEDSGMGDGLSGGMRWSAISMVGREASRLVFTVLLARLVGPEGFGIAAQAIVYIGVVGLLLDQGFSSALIQRRRLENDLPGAVVSVNLAIGAVLSLATLALAPLWADFMSTPQLTLVLAVLAPDLVIRAIVITPRALLLREMAFRKIGIADIGSALVGGVLGVVVAELGGSYWAIVVQTLSTDAVLAVLLLLLGAGRRPNFRFRILRKIAGFSGRAFAAGLLINSVSRNIDSLLIGKFLGPEPLAFYGLANRLLLLPVRLVNTTIGGVLFPAFSRLTDNLAALRTELARATRVIAVLALPAMALISAAAPQLVLVLFGQKWLAAVPIVQVLAVTGALQTVYQPTTAPLVLGLGHARLNLRYAWLTTLVSGIGIVCGLPFGAFGVAVGYTIAAGLLVPVEWLIRRHLLGITLRSQAAMLLPGVHVAGWTAAAYLLIAIIIPNHDLAVLMLGLPTATLLGVGILRVAHRGQLAELVHLGYRLIGAHGGQSATAQPRRAAQ